MSLEIRLSSSSKSVLKGIIKMKKSWIRCFFPTPARYFAKILGHYNPEKLSFAEIHAN